MQILEKRQRPWSREQNRLPIALDSGRAGAARSRISSEENPNTWVRPPVTPVDREFQVSAVVAGFQLQACTAHLMHRGSGAGTEATVEPQIQHRKKDSFSDDVSDNSTSEF